jgi:hypothetical protein
MKSITRCSLHRLKRILSFSVPADGRDCLLRGKNGLYEPWFHKTPPVRASPKTRLSPIHQLLTVSDYTQTAMADSLSPMPLEYQFYLPPETIALRDQASVCFKQGRSNHDLPVLPQLGFTRRLPVALHPVHRFQPFNAFSTG